MNAVKSLTMAVAVLAITGCSQNEVTEINPDLNREVSFNVYTGVQTKGKETTTAMLKVSGAGFGMLAYYTGGTSWEEAKQKDNLSPNFMYNTHATWSDPNWTYSPTKYWPNTADEKISFFAYAPYSTGGANGISLSGEAVSGEPFIDFTVNSNPANQTDLVIAKALDQTNNGGSPRPVNLTFRHLLTRVQFKAKAATTVAEGTYIFITGLKIAGGSGTNNKLYSKAKWIGESWNYDNVATFSDPLTLTGDNILDVADQSGTVAGYGTHAVNATGTASVSLLKNGEYLFLIPVNSLQSGEVQALVSYDVVSKNPTDADNPQVSHVADMPVNLTAGTLAKGTAYCYTFGISLNAITLTVSDVPGWSETSQEL